MVSDRRNGIYRGVIAAAFGLALVGASEPARQQTNQGQRDSSQPVEQALKDIAAALQNQNEPPEYNPPCQPGADDRKSDLCAQWKAADGAAASALWTERAFYLGIGGLIVGIATLGAAIAAAWFARKAADHTERGANAAEGAVAETRRVGEAQTRAYLTVLSARILFGPTHAVAECAIFNSGQSPARDVHWDGELSILALNTSNLRTFRPQERAGRFEYDLASQAEAKPTQHTFLDVELNAVERAEIAAGRHIHVSIKVVATGRDVFGVEINTVQSFSILIDKQPHNLGWLDMTRVGKVRLKGGD